MKAGHSTGALRLLVTAALIAFGVMTWVGGASATHAPPGTPLWGYSSELGTSHIVQYDIGTDTFTTSCTPPGSFNGEANGRGIAFDPTDGNLWYTFLGPAFVGDGLIHKTTPPPLCNTVTTIPFCDGPGGTTQDAIGAMDVDPDDGQLWVAGYQPIGGQSFLYKVDSSSGAILQSCSVPFGDGGEGNDTLTEAKLPGLTGSGNYLLTDAGEVVTSGIPPGDLLVVDEATCIGGGPGTVVTTYQKIINMTGIDYELSELIATGAGFIYSLGGPPFGSAQAFMSEAPGVGLEDITMKTQLAVTGMMTGGGFINDPVAGKVTHGFELHCIAAQLPNNLEVVWGKGNRFHLQSLSNATCFDSPTIAPNPPGAPFDTYQGSGSGLCNGSAATAQWKLTDAGEPGSLDAFSITINGCSGPSSSVTFSGNLGGGNQQAHS